MNGNEAKQNLSHIFHLTILSIHINRNKLRLSNRPALGVGLQEELARGLPEVANLGVDSHQINRYEGFDINLLLSSIQTADNWSN